MGSGFFSGVGPRFRAHGPEFRETGLPVRGFRVWGFGFRISGLGFRVLGFGLRVSMLHCPRGVVADRDIVRVDVGLEERHDAREVRLEVRPRRLAQVPAVKEGRY